MALATVSVLLMHVCYLCLCCPVTRKAVLCCVNPLQTNSPLLLLLCAVVHPFISLAVAFGEPWAHPHILVASPEVSTAGN